MPERPMLELKGASASYGSVPAISNVSIAIGEGEAVGLLGANGAGKSTTLKAISGLLVAERGEVRRGEVQFLGRNIGTLSPQQRAALRAPPASIC